MINAGKNKIIPLTSAHCESLRQHRISPETWPFLTTAIPINDLQQKKWFEALSNDSSREYYAIVTSVDRWMVGVIRSDKWDRENRSVRIGIDIFPRQRKKGYASIAFSVFVNHLFLNRNINRIWFFVLDTNKIAQKIYRSKGFQEEGRQREAVYRDGQYHDYVMMSLLKAEWQEIYAKNQTDS